MIDWTPERIAWLRREAPQRRSSELAAELAAELGYPVSRETINSAKKRYMIRTNHRKGWARGDPSNPHRLWSEEQLDWLARAYRQVKEADIRPLMDRAFPGHGFTDAQIAGAISRYRLRSGRDTRIKPGTVPWNKGLAGYECGGRSPETRFRPGNQPPTWQPVGTYVQDTEGLWKLKVADDRDAPRWKNWRYVHRLTWEAAHGPVPRGHAVVFLDGDQEQCFDPDNLALVPRAVLVRLNQMDWRTQAAGDRAVARALIALATLHQGAHSAARRADIGLSERRRLLPRKGAAA